jgi:hypothetical protein
MFCPACKKETPDNSVFCIVCGNPIIPLSMSRVASIESELQSRMADRLTLAEYQLGEKVESRVWDSLKRQSRVAVIGFGIIGTVLAFFGGSVLLDYVTSRVKEGLQQDSRALEQKIREQLADALERTAELKVTSDAATAQLDRLKKAAQESNAVGIQLNALRQNDEENSRKVDSLEKAVTARIAQSTRDSANLKELTTKIESIKAQTSDLERKITDIRALSANADLRTSNLGDALLKSGIVGPVIVGGPISFETSATLTGTNFGNVKGHLYLRVNLSLMFLPERPQSQPINSASRPIEVEPKSILRWEDGTIQYVISNKVLGALNDAERALRIGNSGGLDRLTEIEFQVETESGKTSAWYGVFVATLPDAVRLVAPGGSKTLVSGGYQPAQSAARAGWPTLHFVD